MEEPINPRPRADAPPAAAVAVSVAVSLPLWRAALAGNTYILQPALLPLHGTLAGVVYAATLAGIGLALALGVLPCARRVAAGGGALLAPLGLLVLAALLFGFQFGSPVARWLAALLAFPAATITWGALAQRSAGAGSRFLVGWFAGLALDVLLRLAASSYDLIWQAGGDVVVIVMAIAAAVSGVVTWPRGPAFAPLPISPLAWLALPAAAYLALAGTQSAAAMAVELGRPAAAAALISLGYLLIGLSVATGLARTSTFGEVAAAALLIALAVIDRSWETFTLALFGPIVAGATLAGVLVSPEGARPGAATLAAFFGIVVTWLAVCVGGVRENLYPNGASLDGICAAVALLAVNRGLLAVRLPARSARSASAALLGALAVGASVFLRPAPGVPAGRSLSTPVVAMTFNIHRGVGSDRALDLERIERVITAARPDLVGIQEVSRGRKTEAGIDELRWLAEQLHMDYAFAPTLGPCFGLGLLSSARIERSSVAGFAMVGDGGRGALIAELDAGPSLTVAVSQLDSSTRERRFEAQSLAAADTRGDALLLLDLSAGVTTGAYGILTKQGAWTDGFRPGSAGGFTYPAANPSGRRDVILFRGSMTAGEGRVDRTLASTHRPVTVHFTRP